MVLPYDLQVAHSGQVGEGRGVDRPVEHQRHSLAPLLQERLGGLQGGQSAAPHDGHAVADPFHLGEDVRGQEDGAPLVPGFTQHLQEGVLHQRIQPGGRFVEDHELRTMEEGLYQAELLPVAPAEAPHRHVEVEVETLGDLRRRSQVVEATQPCRSA